VKKSKPISDDDDLASKDDDDQPDDDDDNDRDDDREDNNTAKVPTAYNNRRRRRRGGSCCSLQDNKAAVVASTTAVSTNSDLQPAAKERIKDEVEMEVDVELEEEEEESRAQFLGLTSAPVQQQLSLEERQLREAEGQLEEQLPPDQLVYDFSSSDYLLPFDDLKFYMDQEERSVPHESQQQQQELEPFLPDSSSESGFTGGGLSGFHAGPTLLQPLLPASSQFPWSPVEAPPPVTTLPRYDHISPSSAFDKDRDVNVEVVSGRLLELVQPQPHMVRRLTSCPSCHCDLSCTAAAAAVVSPPQLSCDSFLSFPENSLDIEKFL
jgi:hypothetical protein